MTRRSLTKRVVAVALAVSGGGTLLYPDLALSRPASGDVATAGAVHLVARGAPGGHGMADVPSLVPGDTAEVAADLMTDGARPWRPVRLTITATTTSLLDQDHRDGLQLAIRRCATPWAVVSAGPRPTYDCPAGSVPVLAPRPLVGRGMTLSGLDGDDTSGTRHLLFSFALPESAGNEFQGLSSTVEYLFSPV